MKILALVTDAYGGHGGIALYNRDVLRSLCEHEGVDKVVAIPRCAGDYQGDYPKGLIYETSGISNSFLYLKAVIKVLINQQNFSIIFCCHLNLMPLAWLISKLLNIPVVLEIYGIEAWEPRGKWLVEHLAKRATLVISISDYTRTRFLSWSHLEPEKCQLLPNAIHAEEYGLGEKSEVLIEKYGVRGKKVILTLGRIVSKDRAKGFDEVLDVLSEIVETGIDIVYVIAGEGDYSVTLKEKVNDLKLNDSVVFTGMIDEIVKGDIFRLADVYVMPSRGEGFGFVFLEAMACGIPVIASKLDGSREAVLNGELGAIVDPNNKAELKEAILSSFKEKKCIPDKLEYFSYHNFRSRLHCLIDNLMTKIK